MYVEDNNDWLVPNNPPNSGGGNLATWAKGDIRYGNPDGTNIDYIIGQRQGSLGPSVKTEKIFNCPTDRSVARLADAQSYPRVRSYSMNGFMGTRIGDNGGTGATSTFLRREECAKAGRPELLVFLDVHEDTLTTCIFVLDRDKNLELWAHVPASRHAGSGVISYTDGHAEIHRWRDARTLVPVKSVFQGGVVATGSPDWKYVWERLTKGTAPSAIRKQCARANDTILPVPVPLLRGVRVGSVGLACAFKCPSPAGLIFAKRMFDDSLR